MAVIVGMWGSAGWGSAGQFFVSGVLAGAWIGLVGAALGAILERSRGARIVGVIVVLGALVSGAVVFVLRGGW